MDRLFWAVVLRIIKTASPLFQAVRGLISNTFFPLVMRKSSLKSWAVFQKRSNKAPSALTGTFRKWMLAVIPFPSIRTPGIGERGSLSRFRNSFNFSWLEEDWWGI